MPDEISSQPNPFEDLRNFLHGLFVAMQEAYLFAIVDRDCEKGLDRWQQDSNASADRLYGLQVQARRMAEQIGLPANHIEHVLRDTDAVHAAMCEWARGVTPIHFRENLLVPDDRGWLIEHFDRTIELYSHTTQALRVLEDRYFGRATAIAAQKPPSIVVNLRAKVLASKPVASTRRPSGRRVTIPKKPKFPARLEMAFRYWPTFEKESRVQRKRPTVKRFKPWLFNKCGFDINVGQFKAAKDNYGRKIRRYQEQLAKAQRKR
jgi:hypothetical protein